MQTVGGVNNIVRVIWQNMGGDVSDAPTWEFSSKRTRVATSYGHRIVSGPKMGSFVLIAHEVAHSFLRKYHADIWMREASHGPAFARTQWECLGALAEHFEARQDGPLGKVARLIQTKLMQEYRAHGVKFATKSFKREAVQMEATQFTTVLDNTTKVPTVEPTGTIHTAASEISRRAHNRRVKREGGEKKPFPTGANPALFKASAAELRNW